jgi:hypothetical protein
LAAFSNPEMSLEGKFDQHKMSLTVRVGHLGASPAGVVLARMLV